MTEARANARITPDNGAQPGEGGSGRGPDAPRYSEADLEPIRARLAALARGDFRPRTEPADDFTVSVAPADGFLVYRWTLKPGRTVPALQQVFAAQYNHKTGKRDASKDTFRVETTVAGHTSVVWGNFPAGS